MTFLSVGRTMIASAQAPPGSMPTGEGSGKGTLPEKNDFFHVKRCVLVPSELRFLSAGRILIRAYKLGNGVGQDATSLKGGLPAFGGWGRERPYRSPRSPVTGVMGVILLKTSCTEVWAVRRAVLRAWTP